MLSEIRRQEIHRRVLGHSLARLESVCSWLGFRNRSDGGSGETETSIHHHVEIRPTLRSQIELKSRRNWFSLEMSKMEDSDVLKISIVADTNNCINPYL